MHDAKGRELKEGDVILVPFKITGTSATEDYCNVSAQSIYKRSPDDAHEHFSGNAKVCLRANQDDENDFSDLYE